MNKSQKKSEQQKKLIQIKLPLDAYLKLEAEAKQENRTVSGLAKHLVLEGCNNPKTKAFLTKTI